MRFGQGENRGIYLISPLGGTEQKLASFVGYGQMSWSPDGKFLAVARGANRDSALVLVPIGGGEAPRLPIPAAPGWDWCPAFSPDGLKLAYARCSGSSMCDVYVQELSTDRAPQGERRRITRQDIFINGLAWSEDGKSLIFGASVGHGVTTYLWRVDAKGTNPPVRIELAGRRVSGPAVAVAGHRLAFTRLQGNADIWRYASGGVAEPFLTSSLIEWHPRFSPDGKKVVFSSDRGGDTFEIWVANADGSNPVPVTNQVGRYMGSPDWSPDGRWIAFDCQSKEGPWKVWVVEATGIGLRRLTSDPSDEVIPIWSRDGKSVYFRSNRSGRDETWRIAFTGGPPEQITTNGGHTAVESVDGKVLYYTKGEPSPIFEMPLANKRERQIIDYVFARAFAVVEDGIYYIGRRGDDRRHPLLFHQFATGRVKEITRLESVQNYGLTVSPDQRTFLFTKSVATGSDIMLVENFR
jgi:Tol biopolymer transport system component